MPPPERAARVTGHAPIPKQLLNSAHSYQRCAHSAKKIERLPEGHAHYAAERCADCGRLLQWIARPENVERQRVNAFRLAKLAMIDSLTDWERGFVRSVSQQKKVSPKQQQIIDRLCREYLEGKTP